MNRPGLLWSEIKQASRTYWFDLLAWGFSNVLIGTASIWLSWIMLFLLYNPRFSWLSQIENGSLAVFVLTLCGSQISVFAEFTKQRFVDMQKIFLILFVVIIICAAVTGSLAAISSSSPPTTLSPEQGSKTAS